MGIGARSVQLHELVSVALGYMSMSKLAAPQRTLFSSFSLAGIVGVIALCAAGFVCAQSPSGGAAAPAKQPPSEAAATASKQSSAAGTPSSKSYLNENVHVYRIRILHNHYNLDKQSELY